VLPRALAQLRVRRRRLLEQRPSSMPAAVRVRVAWSAKVQQPRPASAQALRREPVQEQHPLR
jgi:hypothetical protein